MTPLEQAIAMLASKSPDEIAALMEDRNIKGRPGTTRRCPLTEYFHGALGGSYLLGQKWIIREAGRPGRVRVVKNHPSKEVGRFA